MRCAEYALHDMARLGNVNPSFNASNTIYLAQVEEYDLLQR